MYENDSKQFLWIRPGEIMKDYC